MRIPGKAPQLAYGWIVGRGNSNVLFDPALVSGRNSMRRRSSHARMREMMSPAYFEHPSFEPAPERLVKDRFYNSAGTFRPDFNGFSGTDKWAARVGSLPEDWIPEGVIPWGNYRPFDDLLTRARRIDVEPVRVELGAAFKKRYSPKWYAPIQVATELELPREYMVNADHAMAVYKLAGEKGFWRLEYRPTLGPGSMALTLRDETEYERVGKKTEPMLLGLLEIHKR